MSDLSPCFMFLVIVPIIIIAIVAAWYASQARKKALTAWCVHRGLSFSESRREIENAFPLCGCFSRGHNRYGYNFVRGSLGGRTVAAFDYHYETGSGKNHHTYRFSAVTVDSPVPLEPLTIRREGFFDKVAGFFGHEDINFESADFSREFHVSAPNRRWAYDVLSQRTIEFLLGRDPHWGIQFERGCVVVWADSTMEPAEFEAAISLAVGILDGLPQYVLQQQERT